MTYHPHHFKGLGKEPGEQSPPDPVHPEDYCEGMDCENYDWDNSECLEGHSPDYCPKTPIDEETKGDMEYHRKVDEGEM